MKWFFDLRTMVRLGLSFGAMVVLLASVGWVALGVASESNDAQQQIYKDVIASNLANKAQIERLNVAKSYRQAMLEATDASRSKNLALIDEAHARFQKDLDALEPVTFVPEQKGQFS